MKCLDWWLGVVVIATAVLFHAFAGRYDWRIAGDPTGIQQLIRLDRLTGLAVVVNPQGPRSVPN